MSWKRGISNLLVALLVLSAVAIAIPTLFISTYVSKVVSEARAISYLEVDERVRYVEINASAIISGRDLAVVVSNRGGKHIEIEKILVYTTCSSASRMIDMLNRKVTVPPGSSYGLSANLYSSQCENPRVSGVYIVTPEPRVYSASIYNLTRIAELIPDSGSGLEAVLPPATHVIIPIPIRIDVNPWDLENSFSRSDFQLAELDNRYQPTQLRFLSNYSILSRGMSSRAGVWTLSSVREGVRVSASRLQVRNVFLGYDPRAQSKYVLLITSDQGVSLNIDNSQITYCSGSAVRLVMYGFTSTNPSGILKITGDSTRFGASGRWITSPDQDVAEYVFINRVSAGQIEFYGRVDRLEAYCLSRNVNERSSYSPYMILLNNVGRVGFSGILFTTIDAVYGHSITDNDAAASMILQDFSESPLALVYRRPIPDIRNDNVKAVAILLNYRFHDNEGNDFIGVSEDRPILTVGLVDEDGKVLSYRTFTFRELTRYEDTYPPTAQAQSALVFIPLPSRESIGLKRFYVFIVIQDPYRWTSSGKLDDVDITLYIDSLSVTLFE
ncbi:MAG: hypothetical protein RMI56_03730 [Sulfolobales archaeon]|nr:hypothetical protein [Sulfolobales archaeon]